MALACPVASNGFHHHGVLQLTESPARNQDVRDVRQCETSHIQTLRKTFGLECSNSSNRSRLSQLGLAWGRDMAMDQMRVNIQASSSPFFFFLTQSLRFSDDSDYNRPLYLYTHDTQFLLLKLIFMSIKRMIACL